MSSIDVTVKSRLDHGMSLAHEFIMTSPEYAHSDLATIVLCDVIH